MPRFALSLAVVAIGLLAGACSSSSGETETVGSTSTPWTTSAATSATSATSATTSPAGSEPGVPSTVPAGNDPVVAIEGFTPYAYKETPTRTLFAHVIEPSIATDAPAPAVVFFYGGGWNTGSPTAFERQARHFADRGMVVVLPEYRINSVDNTFVSEATTDARSLLRWVRANAAALGIDPDRIATGGGSAGGHLGAIVSAPEGLDDPADDLTIDASSQAQILFNPAVGFADQAPELWPAANVTPDTPPTLIAHGTADSVVPIHQVRMYCDSLTAVGVSCTLDEYADREHGFFNQSPDFEATLEQADAFLVELGWLAPT